MIGLAKVKAYVGSHALSTYLLISLVQVRVSHCWNATVDLALHYIGAVQRPRAFVAAPTYIAMRRTIPYETTSLHDEMRQLVMCPL